MKDDILSGDFSCGNLFYLEAPLIVRTPAPLKTLKLYTVLHMWGGGGVGVSVVAWWDGMGVVAFTRNLIPQLLSQSFCQ